MSQIHVTPAKDRHVRSPDHNDRFLPSEGNWITMSPYWQRRIDDQDVAITEPQPSQVVDEPAAPPPPAPEAPADSARTSKPKKED